MKLNREQLKDEKKRMIFKENEYKKIIIKSIIKEESMPLDIKTESKKLMVRGSITHIRRRCKETGRSRSVIRP